MTVDEENALPLSAALAKAHACAHDKTLAKLYEWVGENYSSDGYDEIRAGYQGNIDPKFLAICERVRRLLPIAKHLSWHERSGLRTLDLGSGSGHMGIIAGFFGHACIGIDCQPIFDRLRAFWGQTAIVHRIEAEKPLPPIGTFHSITSIMTNYGRAWSVEEWDGFLDRIIFEHLEPGGEFVLNFPGSPMAGNRRHLCRRVTRVEEGRYLFFARSEVAAC